jgi:hypothetical protein
MGGIDDWFDVGERAYRDGAGGLPPLNDIEARRWWLGGFGAAWAVGLEGESVDEALARVCTGRVELLRQLGSHRTGWGSRREQ